MLEVKQLSYRRGTANIEGAHFSIPLNAHVGILGPNGAGKSTLLALLQGQVEILAGHLGLPKGWRWNEVAQTLPNSTLSALEYVKAGHLAFAALNADIQAAEAAGAHEKLATLHDAMATIDGYRIEAQAATMLNGLGFDAEKQQEIVNDFSGGWRMRLNLARALLNPAEGLLLDEPTNHLDLEALIWLEKWLQHYPGFVAIVAHDSAFLDQVADHILHFEAGSIKHYRGNYSTFVKQRATQALQLQRAQSRQQQKREHLQSFINRFRAKASKAKQAQARIKQLNKLQDIALIQDEQAAQFDFLPIDEPPNPLMRFKRVALGYQNAPPILKDIDWYLGQQARIGLLGRNGAGKSTFIKALASQLTPQTGEAMHHQALNIGYFSQDELDSLRLSETPLEHLAAIAADTTPQQQRDYLAQYGLHSELALSPVKQLSGGQRARLCLALIIWQRPNLLLLDEPTNHLDLNFRESLTLALQSYSGSLVVVSHDRDFLAQIVDEFFLVEAGQVLPFQGDIQDYIQHLNTIVPAEKAATAAPKKTANQYEQRKQLQSQIRQLEKKMAKTTDRLTEITATLADPALYEAAQRDQYLTLTKEKATLEALQATTEEDWLAVMAQLESL